MKALTDEKTLTKERAIEAMRSVKDPELRLDIVSLGLIYGVEVSGEGRVAVRMTFTSPACPYAPELVAELRTALLAAGFKKIEFEFVFEPPWEPSDEVRMMLGLA